MGAGFEWRGFVDALDCVALPDAGQAAGVDILGRGLTELEQVGFHRQGCSKNGCTVHPDPPHYTRIHPISALGRRCVSLVKTLGIRHFGEFAIFY